MGIAEGKSAGALVCVKTWSSVVINLIVMGRLRRALSPRGSTSAVSGGFGKHRASLRTSSYWLLTVLFPTTGINIFINLFGVYPLPQILLLL